VKKLWNIYHEACIGNVDAFAFLLSFHCLAHFLDDMCDGEIPMNAENLLDSHMQANALYSTPFYIQNSARLSGVISVIVNTYADSIAWEKSDTDWKKKVSDVIRQCGNDMVITVAGIVGGFRHMRSISLKLRELAYEMQHEEVVDA